MMRKLLGPIKRDDVHNFMDDILIARETWEQRVEALRAVFMRLQEANLAAALVSMSSASWGIKSGMGNSGRKMTRSRKS